MNILSGKEVGKFVRKTVKEMDYFDSYDVGCVKEIINKAIIHYNLDANIDVVETSMGETEMLFVNSEADYRLLNKIVTFAMGDAMETTVDFIYEGNIEKEF